MALIKEHLRWAGEPCCYGLVSKLKYSVSRLRRGSVSRGSVSRLD